VNPFATAAMAQGYASNRPALHDRIIDSVCRQLALDHLGDIALDIGCGSGLSTQPLVGRSRLAVGIEPVWEMARCACAVAPGAVFVRGQGERMPFADASVDTMTAAGSLNFANPAGVLLEAHRALKPSGVLIVYDFSQGRSFHSGKELSAWFDEFVHRYPRQPSEAIPLDPNKLARMAEGFRVAGSLEFSFTVSYDWSAYLAYMMTEVNIAAAIRRGEPEADIRAWLSATLPTVFGGGRRDVVFPGYWVALLKP
jgi:SAM-dependent methyltransferase